MSSERTEKEIMGIDLRILALDLLRGVKRLWWLGVALILLLPSCLAWRTARSYYPVYQASASFTVFVSNPLYSGIRTYNSSTAAQMERTFPYILTSGVLNERVMEKLGVSYLPSISASTMSGTNIFTLSVTSGDPQLAYDVLNATIECYPDVAEFVVGPTEMHLLDESGVPDTPINRINYTSAVKRGVTIAVVLWAAAVLVLALTRSTIHNEKELERLISLRCIGMVPAARKRRKGEGCPILTRENDRFGFGESIRLLRIRVEKEMRGQGQKILLVSSAIPGEGKTTVAANLAIALAHKGKRTLLVDCDLRNPSIAALFGRKNSPGLSAYLNGTAAAEEIICPMEIRNLYAVFGGPPVANASELLARAQAREFLEAVRGVFDYVILDTPPSSLLADAAELAELADCAIMVIRQNCAPKSRILDGVQTLSDGGLPLIGCVLNGVEHLTLSGSSGYYGYGKYGSAYGEK